jgi:hypothetical protein
MADRLGVETIDREGRLVVIKFRPAGRIDPLRLVKVVGEWPGAVLVPPVSLKLDLDAPLARGKAAPPPAARTLAGRSGAAGARRGVSSSGASWWTARATAGEVRPGFTKEEILRRPETDPRAEGGMFSRVSGLLQALS